MDTLREALEKINISRPALFEEPMSAHTSFRIGGPAEAYLMPGSAEELARILGLARDRGLPAIVLGGGSNVLISDKGLRGLVVDLSRMDEVRADGNLLIARAGASMEDLCRAALDASLTGLEFASGLPGRVGGAVYMNARCYDREMSDVVESVEYLSDGEVRTAALDRSQWSYKRSPFHPGGPLAGAVVLGAAFALAPGDRRAIEDEMARKKLDREGKGHYLFPCAGSVFKNNRDFGEPTGRILDRLGFRGMRLGGAAVAEYHANIFVNPGGATAADMKALMDLAEERAFSELGVRLEREVVLLGDFS